MPKKFNAEEHIIGLNTLRLRLIKAPFTSEVIREGFKDCGIPSNPAFWYEFRSSGLISIVDKDLYCFNEPKKPIHFAKLNEIYRKYQEKSSAYYNKWYNKNKRKDVLKRPDIQAAIKLLNENGLDVVLKVQKICYQFILVSGSTCRELIQVNLQILTVNDLEIFFISAIFAQ